ncbi:D-serine deaminase [Allorhizobium ampelinum S4]|uniref:D-serine deaminase n=2 Tax=Rhizobiaceae TaxID=82115 RepID=B9K2T7_ALLAM|nr:D-serine deaminase [Allorhizobium ampelinum S4]
MELQEAVKALSNVSGTTFSVDTKAELDADLAYGEGVIALVWQDDDSDNDGYWRKLGASGSGSWVWRAPLPSGIIWGVDSGAGTANAISVITRGRVSGYALIGFRLFESTTSEPATVAFNGGAALTIKTNQGTNASALSVGMWVFGIIDEDDDSFRLLIDEDISELIAQAESARDAANEARVAAEEAASAAAASVVGAVKYNQSQSLTISEQQQVITNIGLTTPSILRLIGLPFVTLDMFSGGVSASASANLTALTSAIAEKKKVEVRRGVYQMNGATFTVTDPEDIVIIGEGRNTSLFSYPTAGDTGLIFNYSMASLENWWGDACTFRVENLGFRGNGAASKGLTVQQLSSTGNIRLERVLKNLSFAGRASGEYLGTGLVTTNASYLTMDGIFYRGDGTNGTAYSLNGQLDSLDNSIARLYASECATGINVSGKIEGLTISDSRLVNLANGIFVSPYLAAGENVQPWVSISNSHIAARSRGIYATDIAQLQATSNLIYLVSGSSDAIGIDLLRTEAYGIGYGLHQIIGNQVFNQQGAVGTTIGIRFESSTSTGQDHSVCDGNIVANLNIGIQTYATSNQISGQNRATGCTTALNDNGSNTNLTVLTS